MKKFLMQSGSAIALLFFGISMTACITCSNCPQCFPLCVDADHMHEERQQQLDNYLQLEQEKTAFRPITEDGQEQTSFNDLEIDRYVTE